MDPAYKSRFTPAPGALAPLMVERVEEVLRTWVYPQRKRLGELARRGLLDATEVQRALKRLTEAASQTLGVERTSVWKLRDEGSAIECLDLFRRAPAEHEAGAVIPRSMAPGYFTALASERVISAHDAYNDPRTSEFRESYLEPQGITSMLDAPVFVQGKVVAVICHEHVGPPRHWQFWEELVASTFADFVALALDSESRTRDQAAQRAQEEALKKKVEASTEALGASEKSFQALLDAAPVALVLTRASDQKVVYGNARAFALFETTATRAFELASADFWVDDDARQGFVGSLLSDGRVDAAEVRLRSQTGRVFWVRMNAQALRFRGELMFLGGMVDVSQERQAQDNLTEVFARAPMAMVISRLGDHSLLDGNHSAEQLFGLEVDKARGRPAPDFWVEPRARQQLIELVKAHGRVDGFEARLKRADQTEFWAELSASVIQFNGGPALLIGCTDISVRKHAEVDLKHREQLLSSLIEAVPDPLVVTGLKDGVVRYCNAPAAAMFELEAAAFVGRSAPEFYVDQSTRLAFLEQLKRTGAVQGFSVQLRTAKGKQLWALLNARLMDLEGEAAFIVGFADVSAQKALEERLRALATIDELTQVYNRRHFFELGNIELARARRNRRPLALAMIDIDHFKTVNDELGHSAGDEVLRGLTASIKGLLRQSDLFGRLGGEEFAVLLPESPLWTALPTVERLRSTIAEHDFGLPHGRRVTASFGLAELRGDESLDALLKRADDALYEAKAQGRNRVVVRDERL